MFKDITSEEIVRLHAMKIYAPIICALPARNVWRRQLVSSPWCPKRYVSSKINYTLAVKYWRQQTNYHRWASRRSFCMKLVYMHLEYSSVCLPAAPDDSEVDLGV